MNHSYENWAIPKEFYNPNPGSRSRIEKKLSDVGKNIKCPPSFNGSEINQTTIFKNTFFEGFAKDKATQSNPDEIEIDF